MTRYPRRPTPDRRSGFTLLELILVLSVMGILTMIVLPTLRPADFEIKTAAREVATTLAYAQSQAVLRGHDIILAFDTLQGRIRIHADANNDGEIDAEEDTRVFELGGSVRFGRGTAVPRDIGGSEVLAPVSMAATQDGDPALTFKRNGSASAQSLIYIRTTGNLATDTRALEIARATGRVRCHSFETGTWEEAC